MLLNFNFHLVGLDGVEIKNGEAGKIIASALANSTKGDPLKYWDWANKLYRGESLDLDPSDVAKLKTFIESDEGFTMLAKAQFFEVFDKKPEATKK